MRALETMMRGGAPLRGLLPIIGFAVVSICWSLPSRAAQLKPGESFRDCGGCPEMVVVPAGSFLMGSPESEAGRLNTEGPQREVTIGSFALGKYEVTVGEYRSFVEATGRRPAAGIYVPVPSGSEWTLDGTNSWQDPGFAQTAWHPVVGVSWEDAQAYVDWLARATGKPYRLLTEAEWEYAARAGTTTPVALPAPDGSDDMAGRNLANCAGCGSEWDGRSTAPVGSFPSNAWGLHDLHGNVWEWVEDVWHDGYGGAPMDGSAWTDGEGKISSRLRVNRGGSWYNDPWYLRSAYRSWSHPKYRYVDFGFRVARTLD